MPITGRKYEFIGKSPMIFRILVGLLFANTLLIFLDAFSGHILRRTPKMLWYVNHGVTIQIGLVIALGIITVIFRKHMRRIPRD